jgi:hypothetical protein
MLSYNPVAVKGLHLKSRTSRHTAVAAAAHPVGGLPGAFWRAVTTVLVTTCLSAGGGGALHGQAGTLTVRVYGAGDAPLTAVAVSVRARSDSSVVRLGETDRAGLVAFAGLPAGAYLIRAERLGYEPGSAEARVDDRRGATVELRLRQLAVGLPGLIVEAERRRAQFEESAGATVTELTQRDMKLLPAVGEPDVLRAVEILPGVVSTSDFASSFNVRGGSSDQNLILLDGLPIYNPFHLGGLFSVFNADMVARAEMMTGGFPAAYGGRVSSVLSVETDPGHPGTDVQAGVSVLATRVALGFDLPSAPLDAVGLGAGRARVSMRRSYFDQVFRPFFDFPYHLTDVQGYAEAWTGGGGRITLSGYTGRDVLDLTGSDSFPLRLRWGWGNDVIGGAWSQPLRGGHSVTVHAGYTRFATAIRFPEFDDTEFRSRIGQALLRVDVAGRPGPLSLAAGAAVDRLAYNNLAQSGGAVFGGGRERGTLLGGYVQSQWERGSLLLETGLRADAWLPRSADAATVLQPRVAAKRFFGDRSVALKLAAGRYAQFVHSLRDEELPLGIDIWVLTSRRAPHVVSDQMQVGLEGYLSRSWFGAVETYVRRFDGVTTFNPADDPNDPTDDLLAGSGLSYGADFHVRRERGSIRPMLAVSWLRATREFEDVLAPGEPRPRLSYAPIFDRRVDVDFVLQAMLPRTVELGVRWNLGTGLPYTRPVGAYIFYDYTLVDGTWRWAGEDSARGAVLLGPRNAQRYPTYHRLDAGVRRTFVRRWGTVTPHLDVINMYNQRNVLFYFYQYDRTPPTRSGISMFPLLPTAGFEVRF